MERKRDNISTIFLLPVIGVPKKLKDAFYKYGFINTYLYYGYAIYPFNPLFILFRPEVKDRNFDIFVKELQINPNFIELIHPPGGGILFVFKIPEEYDLDYDLFLSGRYSQLSYGFKRNFDMTKPVLDETGKYVRDDTGRVMMQPTTFFHIFNKTQFLRNVWIERLGIEDLPPEMELYDIMNPKDELLNPEEVIHDNQPVIQEDNEEPKVI